MSRSNNTELRNPATRFLEWSGSEGTLKYFDKSIGEKGERVFVPVPFTFIVLDRLSTITGFSDSEQSGFWSNEIRSIKDDKFTVRTKNGIAFEGLYKDMAHVLNQGAAYAQSVYIAFKDESGSLVLGNFKIHGSAIGSWIEFCKKNDVYKIGVKIASAEPAKKGATSYFIPVYQPIQISEGTNQEAIEIDKQLQDYLAKYFQRNGTEDNGHVEKAKREANEQMTPPEDLMVPQKEVVYDDDLPF